MTILEKIREVLKGIDKDTCQDKDAWWETSVGAEFGARKLKEVEDLVKNCSMSDVRISFLYEFVNKFTDVEIPKEAIKEAIN